MIEHLRQRYRDEFPRGIKAIADMDKRSHAVLISLATCDAAENLGGKLHPVQWEDRVVGGQREDVGSQYLVFSAA